MKNIVRIYITEVVNDNKEFECYGEGKTDPIK